MPEMAAELPPADDSRDGLTAMSFLDHLEELRRRLIYSIIAVTVGFFACWNYHEFIFGYVQRPIMDALHRNGMAEKLVYLNPTEPFNLYLKVAALAGLFVTSPIVLYQVWMFISPGLYRNEKRYVFPFMFSTVLLFLAGGLFAYKMVYPAALTFLIDYGKQFQPMITIGEYTDLFLTIMIGMGVIFELPILVFFLSLMGIVTAGWMWRNLRYSILVIFIIAAIITPTTDILNMCIFAAPMVGLYIISIGIAWLVHPKQRKARKPEKIDENHPYPRRGGRPRPPSRAKLGRVVPNGMPSRLRRRLLRFCAHRIGRLAESFNSARAMPVHPRSRSLRPSPPSAAQIHQLEKYILSHVQYDQVEGDTFTPDTPEGKFPVRNIIAKFPGTREGVIIMAGHYDTNYPLRNTGYVGANDGGSSSGCPAGARQPVARAKKRDGYSVWLFWTDGEEAVKQWTATDSLYGTRHLADKWQQDGTLKKIKAFLLADMIGDADLNVDRDSNSTPWLEDIVRRRHPAGLPVPFLRPHHHCRG